MHINELNQLTLRYFLLQCRKICDSHDYSFFSFSAGTNGWQPVGEQLNEAVVEEFVPETSQIIL